MLKLVFVRPNMHIYIQHQKFFLHASFTQCWYYLYYIIDYAVLQKFKKSTIKLNYIKGKKKENKGGFRRE